ncbi:unnamed protein product, partial [Polarella glacialis]
KMVGKSSSSVLADSSSGPAGRAALAEDGMRTASGGRLEGDLARAARVFCGGPLLHAVQQARLFADSKQFVDMPLREDPEVVLEAFEKLEKKNDKETLRAFVSKYFEEVGSELVAWTPADFCEEPPRLLQIEDKNMRAWALSLNRLWASLGRKPSTQVAGAQQRHSSLPVRFPTVVPGGRFRETYYWDTYWIVRGLLVCGMIDTATAVIENLLDSVRRFGFVPNGTRVYYLDRSQPPLLTDMALAVYAETKNEDWLAGVLPLLEIEYTFWMRKDSKHVVELPSRRPGAKPARLNVYHSARAGPRPESYLEDLETVQQAVAMGRDPAEAFNCLCSGAESGWDFSSRWMEDSAGGAALGKAKLATIAPNRIVPVDLNCLLLRVEMGLVKAHTELGSQSPAVSAYRKAAAARIEAMNEFLWHSESNSYRDFRLDDLRSSAVVSLSDWAAPLWAGLLGPSASPSNPEGDAAAMLESLQSSGLIQAGGAASTAVDTKGSTQWDAPNAWPPLQLMLIEGLEQMPAAVSGVGLAAQVGQRWLASCYAAWQRSGFMYEKYNASRPGHGGGGGEYEPQVGFGWSNGVVLVLLTRNWQAPKTSTPCCVS